MHYSRKGDDQNNLFMCPSLLSRHHCFPVRPVAVLPGEPSPNKHGVNVIGLKLVVSDRGMFLPEVAHLDSRAPREDAGNVDVINPKVANLRGGDVKFLHYISGHEDAITLAPWRVEAEGVFLLGHKPFVIVTSYHFMTLGNKRKLKS